MIKQDSKFASISKLAVVMLIALVTFVACKKKPDETILTYRVLEETLGRDSYGIGFRNEDIALGLEVQRIIDQIIADGTARRISVKWFGDNLILEDQPFLKETTAPVDDQSLEKVLAKEELIIGGSIGTRPMFDSGKNGFEGLDIDLALEVGKRLGIKIKFVNVAWDEKETELNAGNIDCIWSALSITDTRLETMFFAKAYLLNRFVIMVLDDSPIVKPDDITGKKIGVEKGTAHIDIYNADPLSIRNHLKELPNLRVLFSEVETGAVHAAIIDETLARYLKIHNDNDIIDVDYLIVIPPYGPKNVAP